MTTGKKKAFKKRPDVVTLQMLFLIQEKATGLSLL